MPPPKKLLNKLLIILLLSSSLPNKLGEWLPPFPGVLANVSPFYHTGTNFCANGSKRTNAGVVGEAGGPLVPTTPSDPGLLNFSKKLIFGFLKQVEVQKTGGEFCPGGGLRRFFN